VIKSHTLDTFRLVATQWSIFRHPSKLSYFGAAIAADTLKVPSV